MFSLLQGVQKIPRKYPFFPVPIAVITTSRENIHLLTFGNEKRKNNYGISFYDVKIKIVSWIAKT